MNKEGERANLPEESALMPKEKYGTPEQRQEIYQILENGNVVEIVDIDKIRPDIIGTHQNEVDLALLELYGLGAAGEEANANTGVQFIEIVSGNRRIHAIFKPFSGENVKLRRKLVIDGFYKREMAATIVDSELFNLVPPTVIKEVEGKGIGAMIYYIDPEIAISRAKLPEGLEMSGSQEWQEMAVFDWIIGNYDRNPHNILHNIGNPNELYAIDHGCAFCDYPTRQPDPDKRWGPRYQLKLGREEQPDGSIDDVPIDRSVPDNILIKVQEFLAKKDEINAKLEDYVTNRSELEMMWERAQELLEKRNFL